MADRPAEDSDKAEPETRVAGRLAVGALVMMSLASLASSWSSYQATRWGGVHIRSNSEAGGLRTRANRAAAEALAQQMVDIQMYVRWLEADDHGNREAADLIERQFRAEFRPAFLDWRSDRSRAGPQGPETPFDSPAYRLAARQQPDELDRRADQAAAAGRLANQRAERYVLNALIFALVLFLTGMAQTFRRLGLRGWLVAAAALACLYGLFELLGSPVR